MVVMVIENGYGVNNGADDSDGVVRLSCSNGEVGAQRRSIPKMSTSTSVQ